MRFTLLILFTILVGCAAGENSSENEAALQVIPTGSPTAQATSTVTPTPLPFPQPTTPGSTLLHIWMPEPLAPLDNQDAADQREVWVSAFETVQDNVDVSIRLKKANEVGGILQTLRSAAMVAPGALPDLALLRRADLIVAAGAGLIQPLDSTAIASITEDFHPAVIDLGTVNDQLVGLGYTLDVAHLAVPPELMPETSDTAWTFEAVLGRGVTLLFPAGRANILNETFLAQYRAAANTSDRLNLPINVAALENVLRFYEDAAEAGMIPPEVLGYTSSADYTSLLASGGTTMGMMSSGNYLNLRRAGSDFTYAPLPTLDGQPTTVIDGWMWVVTTADAGRQAQALQFLNWIFDVDRHATYADAIATLPTGRTALRQTDNSAYAAFVDTLLEHASLPLTDSAGGVAGRAMQGALVAVLQGERDAETAAEDVMEQLGGS